MRTELPGNADLRVVFMGTPEFAVPTLAWLLTSPVAGRRRLQLVAAYTQPDRPAGRGNRIHASPVKQRAQAAGVAVYQPERIRRGDALAELEALRPDLIVVAAFAQILPRRLLDLPAYGCLNVHASLLPAYRGAAPIHAAILHGDSVTGVTIMHMDEGLDTGGIITQTPERIAASDTTGSLSARLSLAGARLLKATLPSWLDGKIVARAQDAALASMARPIRKEEGVIDWAWPADTIARHVRAMNPWPIAQTNAGAVQLRVLAARIVSQHTPTAIPGTLIQLGALPAVATGNGLLITLDAVQPSGKRVMSGEEWLRGARSAVGTVLGARD